MGVAPAGYASRSRDLLALRKELGLYINLRPTRLSVWPALRGISPLRRGADSWMCRFSKSSANWRATFILARTPWTSKGEKAAGGGAGRGGIFRPGDRASGAPYAFERAAEEADEQADERGQGKCAGDVNAVARQTVTSMARDYPHVAFEHMYVDNASMQILLKPSQFDVIVTGNLFGDILTDEAAALAGSIGLIPSMSRGRAERSSPRSTNRFIAGSAPTLAGKKIWRCPVGMILSATMMLRESFGLETEAQWIESGRGPRARSRLPHERILRQPGGRGGAQAPELTEQIRQRAARSAGAHQRSDGCKYLVSCAEDARILERAGQRSISRSQAATSLRNSGRLRPREEPTR